MDISKFCLTNYSKDSKISNFSLSFLKNKMFVIRTEINKMLVRIENREDPDGETV